MHPGRDENGRFVSSRAPVPAVMGDRAFILLSLNRFTGEIEIDDEFSTPLETWAMLSWAAADREERLLNRAERDE